MGLFCSNYNAAPAPAQPSYGEGMADAMAAQMNQLLGTGEYADIYKAAGYEGADLGDILAGVEAPIRKQTAQIDTDVLRQTILGDADPQTARLITQADVDSGLAEAGDIGKAGMPKVQSIYQKGSGTLTGGALSAQNKYEWVKEAVEKVKKDGPNATYDADFKAQAGRLGISDDEYKSVMVLTALGQDPTGPYATKLAEFSDEIKDAGGSFSESQTFITTNPKTGEAFREGEVVRAGEGMIDLLGDTRGVQQAVKGEGDYASYVSNDPDLLKAFNDKNAVLKSRWEPEMSIEEWGREHYETTGKGEGREVPGLGYSMQDVGRQAGFDEDNRFLGLSALAEDVQAGNLSRQRERDLQDVARLSPLYSDIMEDYKPGTKAAITDAAAVLKTQKDSLTGAGAIDAPASVSENMGDITSGGMSAALARSPDKLRAATSYAPSADIAGGQIGADTLRSALMLDAGTSLAGGLTDREERQISEAFKAQGTMMGRTFDQSAGIAEAKARTLEDRNRQALNRQYAQQVLGQEAGLQQSDLGRGLQASLANQQAANRAAEFGVGSGMQQELAGAQMEQQTSLANQAAAQEAKKYTAQEAMQAQLANEANRQQAASFDVNALQQQQRLNEQLKQAGTLGYVDAATRLAALEDTTTLDPFQAVLNRAGGGSLAGGNQLFGTAQYGLQSGPQYLNPESGLGYISNQATNAANMFGAQQAAGATRQAGIFGGLGTLGAGIAGAFCWVAREVYGAHNPAWLDFRHWMFSSAPRWFFKLYLTFGERFANFISNKPRLKARIRLWMDSKIGR